jgi:hypothetical protein
MTTVDLPLWQRAERIRIALEAAREHRRALAARCIEAESQPKTTCPFPGQGTNPSGNPA